MGGIAELGISVPTLVTQVVTFIILLVVLRFVAYKPFMRLLDERSRRVRESLEQAEAVKAESARAEEEIRKRLEQTGREEQERIARAAQAAEEIRRSAQAEARREADAIISRARVEIQRERDEAIAELRRQFADLTILAAEKVIERSLDRETHRELIEKVLEESTASGKQE
ncbi:MAG: F0F1 ATP synthase subunit B [Dehalococcoidales bacterium]|nr:F0F1 ATP synthase subunit B [Dehalococcoidales bacterium]